MTKIEFLSQLKKELNGLPSCDIEERIGFYSEMIDDRMEDGLTEEEAVAKSGCISDIVNQIISEYPMTKLLKEKFKPKYELYPWETVLLAVTSPIWISLAIAFFSVLISLYVCVWSVIISLWASFVSLLAGVLGGLFAGVIFVVTGKITTGIALFGAGILLIGISILFYFLCLMLTKYLVIFTKKVPVFVKRLFMKKEG